MSVSEFTVPAITKVVTFPGPVEAAFARFTTGLGTWWPLASHSLAAHSPGGPEQVLTARFERIEPGAALVEVWRDGQTHTWGSIVSCDAPHHLVFTWHVGRGPEDAQVVTVRFEPDGEDKTRVTLEHAGWERLGEAAPSSRENYDRGWTGVLAQFVSHTG